MLAVRKNAPHFNLVSTAPEQSHQPGGHGPRPGKRLRKRSNHGHSHGALIAFSVHHEGPSVGVTVLNNRAYYDAFASGYDQRRRGQYHALLDDLEADLVLRYARGGSVLEAGCGTGLILERVRPHCRCAVGVDLSRGMLARARARGMSVAQASLLDLPLRDGLFDAVCCFKVLPHVEDPGAALRELGRLVRPGGVLIAEFYNPFSVRGALWRLKRPGQVARGLTEHDVYVRFHSPAAVKRMIPGGFSVIAERGARILTVLPQAHAVPGLGPLLGALERWLADPLARLGSFYSLVAQRQATKP
jgi:ubiquinone/menaquinone biosynthesis C-methylase UbiE